jgi:hypothetical protein
MKTDTPPGLRFLIYAALSIFPLIGLFLLTVGMKNVASAWDSRYWQRAEGRVLAAETHTSGSSSGATYAADITIGYNVHGREYQTRNLWYGKDGGSSDSSEAELDRLRYAPGRVLPVYYNPANPSEAVVHRGLHLDLLWLLGGGLGFFLPGLMFALIFHGLETTGNIKLGVHLFGLIFVLIGGLILAVGFHNLYLAWISRDWPTAEGVITYASEDVSTSTRRDKNGHTEQTTTYSTALVYKYDVDGRTLFNNQRRFGQLAGSSEDWAAAIAEKYPQGTKVRVAYSPDDPEISVLEPGFHNEIVWVPAAGSAFFLFGAAVVVFIFKRGRELEGEKRSAAGARSNFRARRRKATA